MIVSGLLSAPCRKVMGMNLSLLFKTLALVTALVIVIYCIKALQSPTAQTQVGDPNSVIGLLVGGDQRLLNWCPQGTAEVAVLAEDGAVLKALTSPQDISAVCELMVGGFSQEGTETPKYRGLLRAQPASGPSLVLEVQIGGAAIFKYKGMPFFSPGLNRALERIGAL